MWDDYYIMIYPIRKTYVQTDLPNADFVKLKMFSVTTGRPIKWIVRKAIQEFLDHQASLKVQLRKGEKNDG